MATSLTETRREGARGWGVPMVVGVLLILGGAFALSVSVLTSFISVLYLGVLLVVAGILEIISAIRMRHSEPFLVYLLAGLLALVVGGLCLTRPVTSLASINFLIAGYLFASGLFRGVVAIANRHPRWGWDVVYAVITVGLGVYLLAYWPVTSLWVLGAFVSAEIIARGMTLVAASWVLRDVQHGRMPHAQLR